MPNKKQKKIKEIHKTTIDNYFLSGTAKILVPDKVINIDKKGNFNLVDTLTKKGNLKTIKGQKVITINSNKDDGNIIILDRGTRLKDKSRALQKEILHHKIIKNDSQIPIIKNKLFELEEKLKKTKKKDERETIKIKIETLKNKLYDILTNNEYKDLSNDLFLDKHKEINKIVDNYKRLLINKK